MSNGFPPRRTLAQLLMGVLILLLLTAFATAQSTGVRLITSVDGETLLDHTFPADAYPQGTVLFVLINGVMRFDDVRVTTAGGDVIFADDFEQESLFAFPSLWERGNAGVWMIVNEGGNKVLEQADTQRTGLTDLWPIGLNLGAYDDYTFEFKFKLLSWNGDTYRVNFIPRGINRNDAYMIQYSDRAKALGVSHRQPGLGDDAYFDAAPFEMEEGRWYAFRIDVQRVD